MRFLTTKIYLPSIFRPSTPINCQKQSQFTIPKFDALIGGLAPENDALLIDANEKVKAQTASEKTAEPEESLMAVEGREEGRSSESATNSETTTDDIGCMDENSAPDVIRVSKCCFY